MIAHTIVVGANTENKITDKKANCFLAAHYASQAALRLMRPGNDVRIIYIFYYSIHTYITFLIQILSYF